MRLPRAARCPARAGRRPKLAGRGLASVLIRYESEIEVNVNIAIETMKIGKLRLLITH